MTNNIYMFWIGKYSKISDKVKKLEEQGFKVDVGPSKSDNEFLRKEYSYYAMSEKEGVFSFMSDVWRFWKLSTNEGVYIDASVEIGDDFSKFVEHVSAFDVWLPRSSDVRPECSVMYSNGNNTYFSSLLKYFESFDLETTKAWWVGPNLLTAYAVQNDHIQKNNWDEFTVSGVTYGTLLKIRNKNTIFKYGTGSWSAGNSSTSSWWDRMEENYKNKVEDKFAKKALIRYFKKNCFPSVYPVGLRQFYDASISKSEIRKLNNSYKHKTKIFMADRLIWSKLFRFFANKKAH